MRLIPAIPADLTIYQKRTLLVPTMTPRFVAWSRTLIVVADR